MIFSTPETTDYYYSLVREQRRYEFLAAMFAPVALRDGLIALYALDIELAHIHHLVKEEMMGHIRYAWWQEAVEDLPANASKQPVLQALSAAGFAAESLLPIVVAYRESFPETPENRGELLQNAASEYLHSAGKKWQKATNKITRHRAKHGRKLYSWLLVKLFFI